MVKLLADVRTAFSNLRTIKDAGDAVRGSMTLTDRLSGQPKSPQSDKVREVERYRQWAYTCANKNSSAVSGATLRVFAARGTGESRAGARFGRNIGRPISKEEHERLSKRASINSLPMFKAAQDVEEITDHPVLELLREVNPHHNQNDLMESLSLYLDLAGDAYWHVVDGPNGIPMELWALQAQYMKIVPDADEFIKGYLYGRNPTQRIAFDPDQIIHFKFFNPKDMWYGMSRVEGQFWAIEGSESFDKFETYMADTHGLQQMLIQYKTGSMDARTRRNAMVAWRNALHIAAKMRAPLIADEDFDIKPVQWSPREMAFLGGREWRKQEIINGFGQHPAMYLPNANTANIRGAIYLWEQYGVTPTLVRIEQRLNEKLMPRYNEPRLFVAFDSIVDDDVEQLRRDEEMLMKHGLPLNRILERRGMEPVDGGDVGMVPGNLVPLGATGLLPDPDKGRRPPRRHHQGNRAKRGTLTGPTIILVKADGDVELTGGRNAPLSDAEKAIALALSSVWTRQFELALQSVNQAAGQALQAAFDWVASPTWAEEIVNLTQGIFTEQVTFGAGRAATKLGIELTDFIDRPAVEAAIRANSFKFANSVNATTRDALKQAVVTGEQLGESIPEITKRIESLGADWQGYRAERVARTETARGEMLGQEMEWQESGVVSAKVWDANGDGCPFCLDMNGKVLELGGRFFTPDGPNQTVDFEGKEITLKHEYLDVQGPPLHPNCRCDIQPQLIEA